MFYGIVNKLGIIIAVSAMLLYSQENSDVITAIEVTGLNRTKPHVVTNSLQEFIGMKKDAFDEKEVFAEIKDLGVLEPTSAELIENENGLTLKVAVQEKWSIFPIPVVSTGSGQSSFGLMFLDFNAFGSRDMFVVGGMYGSAGWNVVTTYSYKPRRNGLPGWTGLLLYSHQERENVDKDEEVHRKYIVDMFRASLEANYLFTEHLTGLFSIMISDMSLDAKASDINPPEHDARVLAFNPGISLRESSWDNYFLSQQSILLRYRYSHAISGTSFHSAEYQAAFEKSLIPGFRLNVHSGGVWKSTSDPIFEEGPQRAQVAILPKTFSAQHYAGLSLGLEKYLYKTSWGTFSAKTSWQGVFYDGSITDREFNHGPAGGLNLYLSRLALPAMGTSLAYNMNSGLWQYGFAIGMSF